MPDFKELRERIKIVDVLYRYRVQLRTRVGSEYANCACPLPTHPKDDRNNNCFAVHLRTNRFQCKHAVCGKINGVGDKWGDCINLVMVMGRMGAREAGQQLASWFPNKNAPPQDRGRAGSGERERPPSPQISDSSSPDRAQGYMRETRVMIESLLVVIADENERKRITKVVMDTIHRSYQNGRLAQSV